MRSLVVTLAALLVGATLQGVSMAQTQAERQALYDLQMAHIDANVPAEGDFHAFLIRDLTAYFSARGDSVSSVNIQLLRDGPTQSGVAFPKYYGWVTVTTSDASSTDGVVRVAAIARERFEVTDFVSRADILANPDGLYQVIPAALVDVAVERAHRP